MKTLPWHNWNSKNSANDNFFFQPASEGTDWSCSLFFSFFCFSSLAASSPDPPWNSQSLKLLPSKSPHTKKAATRTDVRLCCRAFQQNATAAPSSDETRLRRHTSQHSPREQLGEPFSQPHSPLWPAATWTPRTAQWPGRSRSPPAVCTGCSWRKSPRRACALLLKRSLLNHRIGHGKYFTSTIWTLFTNRYVHDVKN